ncbi:hypothetical protein [Thermoproteus spherical piliferous virus 1]|uniref:Uncharacterized protein n=1 Tax=Thermoproteus spherical piliferous virus 1 TaxID=2713157 RepID=A0A6G8J451_9VIRU|nr:hypothetical protein QIT51_gp24 [Thermoproteus spherical piliferous virus 1]QIM61629.1 hypothetical protein [Thermoproteus spherical piliferous virus 1]
MRKIPIPLIIAAVFLVAVAIYITYTVNTAAPPIWTSAANQTINLVTPQTYFIYGTEFNRVVDGKSLTTVSQLGSRLATIAVNNTAYIPWIIVSESKVSGSIGSPDIGVGSATINLPMLLAMAYNESQLASMYGTNTICVTINGTSVTLQVNPSGAPGYIALGYVFKNSYNYLFGLEVEYYYVGKVVTANGFTWYMYLLAPMAGAATGKITLSTYACSYTTSSAIPTEVTQVGVSGYLPYVTIYYNSGYSGYTNFNFQFTQVANVTTSTTPVSVPAGSGSTIYGPGTNPMVLGVALPMEAYAFPVNNGPVQITYSP